LYLGSLSRVLGIVNAYSTGEYDFIIDIQDVLKLTSLDQSEAKDLIGALSIESSGRYRRAFSYYDNFVMEISQCECYYTFDDYVATLLY